MRKLAAGVASLCLAATVAVYAQPTKKTHRVGVLHVGDHVPPGLRTLREGLSAMGYEEGRNIHVDFRNLADEETASRTAREFAQTHLDLIVAFGNPAVRAARAATSEIPIVMIHATDPVAEGFVKTLARPGGNVTGFVFFAVSPGKHVELFKQLVPRLQHLLVVLDPRDPGTAGQLVEIRNVAEALKVKLREREATTQGDLERLFDSLKPGEIDGVLPASNTTQIKYTAVLIRLTSTRRMPLAGYREEAVEQGALFSYAPDAAAVGREAATILDRILRGAKPSDLPVEQPRTFRLVINLKTAKSFGLVIPPSFLLRADRVVE